MRALGRWSLASAMKLVVDVAYFGSFVALALFCVLAVWLGLHPPSQQGIDLQVPVRFSLDANSHPFSSTRPDLTAVSIRNARGELVVHGAIGPAVWGVFGFGIVGLATMAVMLHLLRAVFRTLREENPFVRQNSTRIRTIGILFIAGQLLAAALAAWLTARVTGGLSVAGVVFEKGLTLEPWVLLSGVILIMLAEVFRLGAQMKGDLETARRIQFDLVPGEVFRKDDVVVHAQMRPARAVGGDYYDVRDIGDGRLAVVVGDVTGKGLPAALLMTSVLGSLRALLSAGLRGQELMVALNRHVCENTSPGRFVTLFYGELEVATGVLRYVNAGHNPPLLARADGSFDRLEPTAMVLGIAPDGAVEAGQACLGPADRLLLFSDGLSEAFNRKDEEYGEERMRESLARARPLPPPAAIERLVADVLGFCGREPLRDDMTLMLIGRQPT